MTSNKSSDCYAEGNDLNPSNAENLLSASENNQNNNRSLSSSINVPSVPLTTSNNFSKLY